MVAEIVAALRRSLIVTSFDVTELVEEESVEFLQVRAEIIDSSVLYVRELFFPGHSKYSYHWQTSSGEMRLRWDNAPHHPTIPTHPHHKHEGERVVACTRASIEDVLAEIAARLKDTR